jgi:hypothetical protein
MITKKEPITPDILKKIVCTYGNKHCNLKDLRIASMCLICYSGFLRFSELVNLRRSDITFFPTYIKLFLVKSKTDVKLQCLLPYVQTIFFKISGVIGSFLVIM